MRGRTYREEVDLYALYAALRRRFGFLDWWPGDTKDEIIIGAVLTQQTAWNNVKMAIANLGRERMLSLRSIARARLAEVERLIHPSGFYRQKARRLQGIARHISAYSSLGAMFGQDTAALRMELLSLHGVGRETADSIILYAAEKPIFVIDAYTKRAMHRIYGIDEGIDYDDLRYIFESSIRRDVRLFQDFHAQFVELGKSFCRTKPVCSGCPVNRMCSYASGERA